MAIGNDSEAAPVKDLFQQPRPLDRSLHKALAIDRQAGFGFARRHIAVPITLGEFAAAARDYPIVFAVDSAQPFVLLGLQQGHNLLVDEAGRWRKGRYVPAHLRRYPFIFMETPERQFVLCIDEAAEHFAGSGQREPLFVDGNPSPLVGDAMKFLAAFQSEFTATREFGAALAERGLLIDRQAHIELPGAPRFSLTGFRILDEERLAAVEDAAFLDWRRRGWLAPVYFHLQSLGNFGLLTEWAGEGK